jgi:hypothetical protein
MKKRRKNARYYIFLSVIGAALFALARALATAERGYPAIGGELFFLFLPLCGYLDRRMNREHESTGNGGENACRKSMCK